MFKAVFLDRDNTIIRDVPYLGEAEKVRLFPRARQALQLLRSCGYRLFLLTNQSGVGRGYITEQQVAAVHREMIRQLGEDFDGIYCCYDDPESPVEACRKPSPKLIFRARDEHHLDLAASFVVGDKHSDVLAGKRAGCRSVLVLTGDDRDDQTSARACCDYAAPDLYGAARWICRQGAESPQPAAG
jgi:D-glycero-D-manno-heptose 1,7-bisphosphate phosphatase